MNDINFVSAFILGLMGASHCLGMCGGIISSLSMATDVKTSKWPKIISYQLGRIFSYTLFGLIAGWIGLQASQLTPLPILKILSGLLLVLMGLYISRLWMGISYLEKIGKIVWDQIRPLSKKLLPVTNNRRALFLGFLWGWLPCGLIYTSLSYALSMANPLDSGLFMLMFGLGTLPATLFAGAASVTLKTWLAKRPVQLLSSFLFISYGCFILYGLLTQTNMPHHH